MNALRRIKKVRKLDRARNVDNMKTIQQESTLGMVKSRQEEWKNRMQEKCMYRTTKTIERKTQIVVN